jgi:cell division protein FtsX
MNCPSCISKGVNMETPAVPQKKKTNIVLIVVIALAVALVCGCIILVATTALGISLLDFSALR